MLSPEETQLVQTVLNFCNKFRKETGLEPLNDLPKGTPYNKHRCPVARALNHDIYAHWDGFSTNDRTLADTLAKVLGTEVTQPPEDRSYIVKTVPDIRLFMQKFDQRRIDEYIDSQV